MSVCRSVRGKNLNQRYELVHWYFVYKLNKLLWNLGKGAYIIPNVGPSVRRSVGRSVEKIYRREMYKYTGTLYISDRTYIT